MKDVSITEITTTVLRQPDVPGIQDATIRHRDVGRSALFVHIKTDAGFEGLGVGQVVARDVIERSLRPLLIGEDPLRIEKLWDDMFWRVRGFGRKGVAFCGISAIDIGLWDLKAKIFGVPLYRLLGPYTDRVPIYGSGGWTSFSEAELVREQMGYVERGVSRVKMKVAKDFGKAETEEICWLDEGCAHGTRVQPAGRAARGAAGPPASGVLHAQSQGGGVSGRLRRSGPGVVHRVPGAEGWLLVALSGPTWTGAGVES